MYISSFLHYAQIIIELFQNRHLQHNKPVALIRRRFRLCRSRRRVDRGLPEKAVQACSSFGPQLTSTLGIEEGGHN
jgi:hypothetical protein